MKKQKTQLLKLSELKFDDVNELLYPRLKIDWAVVDKYAAAMEAGETFPAIKAGRLKDASQLILTDGRHTVEALKKRKVDYYSGIVKDYDSEAELFADAVRFNASHGRPLDKNDEDLIVERLQKYSFTPDQIQKIMHVPASEIKKHNCFVNGGYTVTSPSGRKTHVQTKTEPEKEVEIHNGHPTISLPQAYCRSDGPAKIIDFKNSLRHIITFLETDRLPDDEESKKLMRKARGLMLIESD